MRGAPVKLRQQLAETGRRVGVLPGCHLLAGCPSLEDLIGRCPSHSAISSPHARHQLSTAVCLRQDVWFREALVADRIALDFRTLEYDIER